MSPSQAERLRSLVETDGWKLLRQYLDQLSQEASDYLHSAETPEDFRYRKGFWDGHRKTLDFVEVLISMAETSDAEWMEKELGKLLEPYRGVTIPKVQEMDEEQEARLSRVLSRARDKNSFA